MDTDTDYEKERQAIWQALTDACRLFAEPKMRMALGLYLRRFPPSGCAS